MKQHYFSLSFCPTNDTSIRLLKQIVEPSVFEAGDKNKMREATINKRYDCLIRILSSVITLTQLDLNTGLYRSHKQEPIRTHPFRTGSLFLSRVI